MSLEIAVADDGFVVNCAYSDHGHSIIFYYFNNIMTNVNFTKKSRVLAHLYEHNNNLFMAMIRKALIPWGQSFKQVKIMQNNIKRIMTKHKTDAAVITAIKKIVTPTKQYTTKSNERRAYMKLESIKKYGSFDKIDGVLDFGGNVGDTAACFRREFGLPKSKTFVVDVREWAGETWVPRDDITFVDADKMASIPTGSVDLITAFHTLHHINPAKFPKIISEFNRILSDAGSIVLYEHNAQTPIDSMLINMEHIMFDIAGTKMTYAAYIKTFYSKYFSTKQWVSMFSKHFAPYREVQKNNIDKSFFLFLRKTV
jgi:hypothetical protein